MNRVGAEGSRRWTRRILVTVWAIFMSLGVVCALVFAQGLMRDHRVGEPELHVNLAQPDARASASFRVWGRQAYRLFVSSVNHDPERVGHAFDGALEIAVLRPDGSERYRRVFDARSLGHAVPDNYGDTRLEAMTLEDWPLRAWRLEARVLEADPGFKGVRTDVKL